MKNESRIEDVIRSCGDCGKSVVLHAEDWKWWWEQGGKTPAIMHTSSIVCDVCSEADSDYDCDRAWQSEHRLRMMEGWAE